MPSPGADHPVERLGMVGVAESPVGDAGVVEGQGDADHGHPGRQSPLQGQRQPPAAGATRLQEGDGRGRPQGLPAPRREQGGRAAVENGLGGAHAHHQVRLHQLPGGPQGHAGGVAHPHQELVLHVVHPYPAPEGAGEGGGEELLQLAAAGAAGKTAGDEHGLAPVGHPQAAELGHGGGQGLPAGIDGGAGQRQGRRLDDDGGPPSGRDLSLQGNSR